MEISDNQKAFLDMIAVSEGTSTSPATQNSGYDVVVIGLDGVHEIFTDYSHHPFEGGRPPKVINHNGLKSTASGRYQELLHNYLAYKQTLNLPDFSPASQDAMAIQQIRETGAIPFIENGHFDNAIMKVAHLWASLPNAGYGQHQNKLDDLRNTYIQAGGSLAIPPTFPVNSHALV